MAFVNLPVELRNLTIPGSSLNLPAPSGARKTARRLSPQDSARLPVGGRLSSGGRVYRVKRLGQMKSGAKVALPLTNGQLRGLVDANWVGAAPVVVGDGARLVRFDGRGR